MVKTLTLIAISLIAVVITFSFVEPVPQDPGYHDFADKRSYWGLPNTLDVLSNIPLAIVGLMGIIVSQNRLRNRKFNAAVFQYLIFFSGVFLTGFGSFYYHLSPSNETLIWDRLPITILSIGFFCSVIAELASPKTSLFLVGPLLLVGIGSVFYWNYTEGLNCGDLRPYGVVQFLPLILIPLMLLMYELPENYLPFIIGLVFFYTLSRLTEAFDRQIFEILRILSGHTLKHIFAAAAVICLFIMLKRGEDIQN